MRTFLKYLFTPGYTLILVTSFCMAFLFSGLALLIKMQKLGFTIFGLWVFFFLASLLATAFRYARYRDFGKDATD